MGKQNTLKQFQVGHFPQKVSNEKLKVDIEWIKATNVLSGGLTEMAWRKDAVQGVLGPAEKQYRVFWDSHGGRPIEIPMIGNRAETSDFRFHYAEISPGVDGSSYIKPRGVSILRYKFRGEKIAQIHTHWDAVLQDRDTGKIFDRTKRVRWAKRSAIFIQKMARRLKELGYAVFITGDFNYRNFKWIQRFRLWYHSPQRMFKRLGMGYKEEGLDYLAWDTSMVRKLNVAVIPPNTRGNHGDHPYLIGSFAWAS